MKRRDVNNSKACSMQAVTCQQRDDHIRTKVVNMSMNVALSHVSSRIVDHTH